MIKITLSEEQILAHPNDFELGEFVRKMFWEKRNIKESANHDEHIVLDIAENGDVTSIGKKWVCSICGENTEKVDYDYLVGTDHLSCTLKSEQKDLDPCVICGRQSPYTKNTHIDHRIGYVEGGGQGCFQPSFCARLNELTRGLH